MRARRERPFGEPRWRRRAAGIAAGLAALVLSMSALALATALQERADQGRVLAVASVKGCSAQLERGCAAP